MSDAPNPVDGVRIAFTVEGAGRPLVLFHGSSASAALWSGLGYVAALAPTYRLILLDARGHGRSDKPHAEDAYAMRLLVSDFIAVLDRLELDQTHFFGYGFSGRVGFGLGAHAPERFRWLTIGGGSYRAVPGFLDRIAFPGALETMAAQGIAAFLDEWERRLGAPIPVGVRAAYLANEIDVLVPYFRRSDREPTVEAGLSRMTMPTLHLVGERDQERFADSHAAAARLPDVTFTVVPGEDHLSTLVRRDQGLPRLMAFLD